MIRCWGICGLRGMIWGWCWCMVWSWCWSMVWCWGWVWLRSMVWSWFWSMIRSWTMVRFLFWVADFAFVFNISVEFFVFINKIIYDSGAAIILYNLVLSFDNLSITFFVSGVDIWSAIWIVIVDIITKYVRFWVVIRVFMVWGMIRGRLWGVIRSSFWGMNWDM